MPDNKKLRNLPSVNETLGDPEVAKLIAMHGRSVVKHAVRMATDRARARIQSRDIPPGAETLVADVTELVKNICGESLKPVVNATGVVLHTNLGRAPLGQAVISEAARTVGGYCNLEYDLANARRGNRNVHVREILKFLTGAEDALVVYNNAAAIMLALNTVARGREVIVSRGELIEIGASFRIPDIMAASGASMVEVGTTNRTRISDYEAAIGDETALLFKAHKSNFSMKGFTEEVSIGELAEVAHARGLPAMYDIGSGLLGDLEGLPFGDEPNVAGALGDGADIVAFSCDKLLGGPQAGILAGRGELISRMAHTPMMRALRVGKLTLAVLSAACRQHLSCESLLASNTTFALLGRSEATLRGLAAKLAHELKSLGVAARPVDSFGRCGGGTTPDLQVKSIAVEVLLHDGTGGGRISPKRLFERLLRLDRPIMGVLREGRLIFDVLTVFEEDIACMARAICAALKSEVEQ